MKCNSIVHSLNRKIKIIFWWALRKITKNKMIIDITGTVLMPGNFGKECRGNGNQLNWRGKTIECCCDECDYMMCCLEKHSNNECMDLY